MVSVRVGGYGYWLRSGLVVRVSRISCGVKRVRLFSERLCIYKYKDAH